MRTRDRSRQPFRTALAIVLATPVHVVSVALLALGVWLLWPGHGVWRALLGIACLLVTASLVLRPRTPRRQRAPESSVLDLSRSPATVGLLREVAGAVGGRLPARCLVTSTYGATSRLTRHGRTLEVGAPLWLALGGEERVALLARTLAPRGRARSVVDGYVGRAAWTLGRWREIFSPVRTEDPDSVFDPIIATTNPEVLAGRAEGRLGADIAGLFLLPFRLVTVGYARLLGSVADPVLQARNELVESAVAAAAGTTAVAGLERAGADGELVAGVLQRATRTGVDLQTALSERTARVDADRPPSTDRPGSVEVGVDEWARMDQEWAPAVDEQFARLRSIYR
jgi:hypothetical protein